MQIIIQKKAQGISVNVIIIADIALIILVVLIAVFTGRFGLFSKGLEEVEKSCARCLPKSQCQVINPNGNCPKGVESDDGSVEYGPEEIKCCLI